MEDKKGLNISVKSFITAIAIIFGLMILTYVLTFIIPSGEYARIIDENGNTIVDTAGGFKYVDGGIPFWKWILSPFLVLAADGSITIIAVIIFLLIIGGAFESFGRCGLMSYMLKKLVNKFGSRRYQLQAVLTLFFMLMGSFLGSFEEMVPLVPIAVALSIKLGWDALTGMAISILACGCGFAAGICNSFTVGVAQSLCGLPMFSGAWLRAVAFILIYVLLILFIRYHSKKIEKPVDMSGMADFTREKNMDRGLLSFAIIIIIGLAAVLCSPFVSVLQDYTLIIVAVMFLVAGIVSPILCRMKGREHLSAFGKGMLSLLPAVLMILMASSIKYTITEAKILDTILYGAVGITSSFPMWAVVLFIYLLVLVMNFFIASGSAKAFLLIPLIVPIAQVFGISSQLCILAFAFGDGFSNVFYPTNPVLLVSLGVSNVSYGSWAKWTWKFQGLNLLLTAGILLLGLAIGY